MSCTRSSMSCDCRNGYRCRTSSFTSGKRVRSSSEYARLSPACAARISRVRFCHSPTFRPITRLPIISSRNPQRCPVTFLRFRTKSSSGDPARRKSYADRRPSRQTCGIRRSRLGRGARISPLGSHGGTQLRRQRTCDDPTLLGTLSIPAQPLGKAPDDHRSALAPIHGFRAGRSGMKATARRGGGQSLEQSLARSRTCQRLRVR